MILLAVVSSLVVGAVSQAGRILTHTDDEATGLADAKIILDRLEAERSQDIQDLVRGPRDRVQATCPKAAAGQRRVERRPLEIPRTLGARDGAKARLEGRLDRALDLVGQLSQLAPTLAGQLGHELEQLRQLPRRAAEARVGRANPSTRR